MADWGGNYQTLQSGLCEAALLHPHFHRGGERLENAHAAFVSRTLFSFEPDQAGRMACL
jgi:hypothetical protein